MNQETRELVFKRAHGYCMCNDKCQEKATDLHHLLSNTVVNRNIFPLFIDSPFNLLPVFNGCHLTKPMPKITPHQASLYETWLRIFERGDA